MAKLNTNDFFKARIDDLLFYRYRDMMVVRTISGFTTESLHTAPQYELSRKNANEFGRISNLCKQVRMALSGILPKQNNLAVVNSLTKKMRQVLEHDTANQRGQRQLASALATEEGIQLLNGYQFNPDTTIALDYLFVEGSVKVSPIHLKFPKGINHIGFRVHQLAFDFASGENELVSGEWVMESKDVVLSLPILTEDNGLVFTVFEAQFYDCVDDTYVPIVPDCGKSIILL